MQLCRHFGGEVVNADALQVYEGLEIITNKAWDDATTSSHNTNTNTNTNANTNTTTTNASAMQWITPYHNWYQPSAAELGGARHHLLGIAPHEGAQQHIHSSLSSSASSASSSASSSSSSSNQNVCDGVIPWCAAAAETIREIQSRNILPVVCGGTNYYIETLIWGQTVDILDEKCCKENEEELHQLNKKETCKLFEQLKIIDPEMADKLHPNDRRKILRSLEIFFQTGEKQSQILKKQKEIPTSTHPRYDVCVLCCDSQEEILDKRVDDRSIHSNCF